jgi:hypothetical protein
MLGHGNTQYNYYSCAVVIEIGDDKRASGLDLARE